MSAARLGNTTHQSNPTPRVRRHGGSVIAGVLAALIAASSLQAGLTASDLVDPTYVQGYDGGGVGATADFSAFHATYGADGSGVHIGVIADNYASALPDVTVLNAGSGNNVGGAMIDLMQQIAPGATFTFHSAFDNAFTSTDPATRRPAVDSHAIAVNNLVAQGVDVIVDSTTFLNQPAFQDGVMAQAVNAAADAGVAYFAAAGNQAALSYESNYRFTNSTSDSGLGTGYSHLFSPTENDLLDRSMELLLPAGGELTAVLHWANPSPSVQPAVVDDDFTLWLSDGNYQVVSNRDQISGGDNDHDYGGGGFGDGQPDLDPWEMVTYTNNTGSEITLYLGVEWRDPSSTGDDPPLDTLLKLVLYGDGSIDDASIDPANLDKPTILGHAAADGAITIASQNVTTPTPDNVNAESSHGPTAILFDDNGNPILPPQIRDTPLLTGLDGWQTSVFGDFRGTGAAAAYAGAVSALLLNQSELMGQTLGPDDLLALLVSTATDIENGIDGGAVYDHLSGWGRIDPDGAAGVIVPEPAAAALLALASAATLVRRRRR